MFSCRCSIVPIVKPRKTRNNMNRKQIRYAQNWVKNENKKYPPLLKEIPRESWPDVPEMRHRPMKVLRSRSFICQVFEEGENIRLTFSRTEIDNNGEWRHDITWDDLQYLKQQAGYRDYLAVEVFPKDEDYVNVANMRHLWIVPGLDVGWKKN